MVDRERVEAHLAVLDGYLGKLRHFSLLPLDDILSSWERIDAFERSYEVALQSMLDVGSHVLAGAGEPISEYRDVPIALVRLGVIPPALGATLADAAGMRNLLAHRYLDIDHARMHRHAAEDAGSLEEFGRAVWRWLDHQSDTREQR